MHACMHACMHAFINAHIHTHAHTCTHMHSHTCIHAYMHARIHLHILAYTPAHTDVHTTMVPCMLSHMYILMHMYYHMHRMLCRAYCLVTRPHTTAQNRTKPHQTARDPHIVTPPTMHITRHDRLHVSYASLVQVRLVRIRSDTNCVLWFPRWGHVQMSMHELGVGHLPHPLTNSTDRGCRPGSTTTWLRRGPCTSVCNAYVAYSSSYEQLNSNTNRHHATRFEPSRTLSHQGCC
jgi:hypothetical protein